MENEEHEKGIWQTGDEPINVTLPRREYELLREMLQQRASVTWATRWFLTVGVTLVAGALTVTAFLDKIKSGLATLVKSF